MVLTFFDIFKWMAIFHIRLVRYSKVYRIAYRILKYIIIFKALRDSRNKIIVL